MIRLLDIFFSVTALLFLSPLFILCVAVLAFTGEKEIFYAQERVGLKQNTFDLLKFATMLKNSPNMGLGTITIKDDPRVLPFGRLLRKTKFNEIPQLINIIRGDMSIIGPRPLTSENFHFYDKHAQIIISSVKPGLSGVGSIVFRNEEELLTNLSDPKKMYKEVISKEKQRLEIWFVKNRCVSVYLKLIGWTVVSLFTNKYQSHMLRFFEIDAT
jgi:lipopolysaccharide/colanic/teichoic acid biosynthesis glycosyltransferase